MQEAKEAEMKTALFIVILLVTIGIGATLLYKIGEIIVEQQDATSHGMEDRKECKDGRAEKSKP